MITIREMQIDDLEQVMPIEEANFSIPWTETGFFTFLIRDDALFLVAEEDGEILGYLGILISFDESEITNVCVAEKARRRGIGRALMEELFRRMQERKVRVIHLDVRIGNTPARNLYESLGFVQDGLRKGYYDLPKEDAVLMSRTERCVTIDRTQENLISVLCQERRKKRFLIHGRKKNAEIQQKYK